MKKNLKVTLVLLSALSSFSAGAVTSKAATCVACHGAKGISVNPLWPNLAGQKAEYIKKQLHDFKEGRRKDPLMAPMAAALSDRDIIDLANYYQSL